MENIEIEHFNMGTPNKNSITIRKGGNSVQLYFSYATLVAVDGVVSQNEWSRTTGKLLNELNPDKKARVPHAEVLSVAQKRLKEVLG